MQFSSRELLDLGAAWVALGVAFTFFFEPAARAMDVGAIASFLPVSMGTVGVAFLLHELAHKVVAVRFGQIAEFRADYGMLFVAIMSGLAGFLFAAPGAVHHRGRITLRENGLISLAGPVTNILLMAPFGALALSGVDALVGVGTLGVGINGFLAAFNMIPYGPLDGKTVLKWNKAVYLLVFLPSAAFVVWIFVGTPGF
ncbi:metalloprotease [Halostella sp. JP-L12]|uniref:metalloprotease n=1 Tax=Halostella TaxID=1843185 RepID=UPI000EF8410A|nr:MULTISPECIES: metalloprotease [Halostella]NHN49029.1 metalloprotease [Halostella sp. JP-L12]